jgi:hypothetical protein
LVFVSIRMCFVLSPTACSSPPLSPSVVTMMAVASPSAACSSSGTAATAALLRLLRPVAAAARPVAAVCFLMRVMQPSMEEPAGAAACIAGVIRGAAIVLPLCRVTLGWMDSGEPVACGDTKTTAAAHRVCCRRSSPTETVDAALHLHT